MNVQTHRCNHQSALVPLYGFLKVTDKATGLSVVDTSCSEVTKSLAKKVDALKLFSSLMTFEYESTHTIPQESPIPIPKGKLSRKEDFSADQKQWAVDQCKYYSEMLYTKALTLNINPPFPLYSALYRLWAKNALHSDFLQNSKALKEYLKSSKEDVLEDALLAVTSFLQRNPVDPMTLKSTCLYLASMFTDSTAERIELKIYSGLGQHPVMPIQSLLYREWASSDLPENNRSISNILICMVNELNSDSQITATLFTAASLIGQQELHPTLLESLSETLSSSFPSFSSETINQKLQLILEKYKTALDVSSTVINELMIFEDKEMLPILRPILHLYTRLPDGDALEDGDSISENLLLAIEQILKKDRLPESAELMTVCAFISYMHPHLAPEKIQLQIYGCLNIIPPMQITSSLYELWAENHLENSDDREFSGRLCEYLRDIDSFSNPHDHFEKVASLPGKQEIHSVILEAFCLQLTSIFPSLSLSQIKLDIQELRTAQFNALEDSYEIVNIAEVN